MCAARVVSGRWETCLIKRGKYSDKSGVQRKWKVGVSYIFTCVILKEFFCICPLGSFLHFISVQLHIYTRFMVDLFDPWSTDPVTPRRLVQLQRVTTHHTLDLPLIEKVESKLDGWKGKFFFFFKVITRESSSQIPINKYQRCNKVMYRDAKIPEKTKQRRKKRK